MKINDDLKSKYIKIRLILTLSRVSCFFHTYLDAKRQQATSDDRRQRHTVQSSSPSLTSHLTRLHTYYVHVPYYPIPIYKIW